MRKVGPVHVGRLEISLSDTSVVIQGNGIVCMYSLEEWAQICQAVGKLQSDMSIAKAVAAKSKQTTGGEVMKS